MASTEAAKAEASDDKKRVLDEHFAAREEQRLAELALKAEKREQTTANHETVEHFAQTFSKEHHAIKNSLEDVLKDKPDAISKLFEDISFRLDQLQQYLNDSTRFLPARSIQSYNSQLAELQSSLSAARASLVPKKKFAFKSRGASSNQKPSLDNTQKENSSSLNPSKRSTNKTATEDSTGVKDVSDKTVELDEENVNNSDVLLQNISNSTVHVKGYPSTVHILNVCNSTVLLGPVATSVFLDKCTNSTFAIACQQLRCHSSENCTFYLHITSRGIIEDTNNIRIAPYAFTYSGIEAHFSKASLTKENNWSKIDDFNWLNKYEKSPNFSVLPDEERTSFSL